MHLMHDHIDRTAHASRIINMSNEQYRGSRHSKTEHASTSILASITSEMVTFMS